MNTFENFTHRDIFDLAVRRRWLIMVSLFVAMVIGICAAFLSPKVYQAETLILVQPQKVPEDFVRSVVAVDADERLSTISQQIMSRSNLTRIIEDFDLFDGADPHPMFLEDKINSLRKQITVEVTRDRRGADAFSLAFRGTDPQKVMNITNALANFFIDANIKERESQAVGTSDFLGSELANLRTRINELEAELKDYRQRYMGELPEQLDSNLAMLQRLQDNLNRKQESLRDVRLNLSAVEKQISEDRRFAGSSPGTADNDLNLNTNDIYALRAQLADYSTRYTDQHPDVIRLKKRIAELKDTKSGSSDTAYFDPLQKQRAELQSERTKLQEEIANINQQIEIYQQRVENTPRREQELLSLKRDYNNLTEVYDSMLNRKLEAEISVSMERKQKGEQFQIIDYAQLPRRPVAPDLRRMFLLSLLIGFGLGGGLAIGLEYLNTAYRKPEDIEKHIQLPVIATIPPVLSRKEISRKRLAGTLSKVFASLILLLFGVFAFVTFTGTEYSLQIVRSFFQV